MKLLRCVLGFVAVATFQINAAVATLNPVADTTISQDNLARADGISPNMIVGHLDPGHADVPARGLMRFDLTSIPSNSIVTAATLRLFVIASASAVDDVHVLSALLKDWDEPSASWYTTGWESWEQSGGDYEGVPDASISVGGIGEVIFTNSTTLAARVQAWVTNSAENRGWMLRSLSDDEGRNARRFATREAAETIDAPVLTVTYSAPPPPPPPGGALSNPRVADGKFFFDFTALAGTNYTVQFKHAADATNWLDLVSYPDPGTQTVFTVEHTLTESNRFYRVVTPPTP